MDLVIQVYKLTASFPDREKFGLVSQMNRSAVSVPSNIAEGAGRNNPKEFYHFLGIAKGSLSELETQLEISKRLKFQNNKDYEELSELVDHVGRMIAKLQFAIKNSGFKKVSEPLEIYGHSEKLDENRRMTGYGKPKS